MDCHTTITYNYTKLIRILIFVTSISAAVKADTKLPKLLSYTPRS